MLRYDITDDMMENCAVTFSMRDVETGVYKIANKAGDLLINDDFQANPDDDKYNLSYKFSLNDTSKSGRYFGEFKLTFLGDHCGIITFPLNDLDIVVEKSLTKVTVIPQAQAVPPLPSIWPYFFGTISSNNASAGANRPVISASTIYAGNRVNIPSNGTININFNSLPDDYIWFAIPSISTPKTVWYVSTLNNGIIGGTVSPGGNLFPNFTLVTISILNPLLGSDNYKVYLSNFQTQINTNMELRNV